MPPPPNDDRDSDAKADPAREHGAYGEDDTSSAKPRPHEKGDFQGLGKRLTGAGNANKGAWKDQGGAGHGENYGARDKTPKSSGKP